MATTNYDDESSNNKKITLEWEIANLNALKELEPKALDLGGFHCKMGGGLDREGKKLMFSDYNCDENDLIAFRICKTAIKLEMKEGTTTVVIEDFGQYWMNFFNPFLSTDAVKITAGDTFPKLLRLHSEIIWAPCEGSLPTVDAIFDVEENRPRNRSVTVPVNRYILAGHSSYFRKLFFGPWKDGEPQPQTTTGNDGIPRYKINMVHCYGSNDFAMMLCGVQLLGLNVRELNYLQDVLDIDYVEDRIYRCITIVKMAFDFELPMWLEYGQEMLISSGPGTMEALELAESLKLTALKKHCLATLDTLDYVKDFGANKKIYKKLCKQTQLLVDKRLENNANRYSRKRKRLDTEEDNDDDEKK